MQPRQLVLRNFGPFIDETIDFSDFEASGLFLISGKTGAGKTTIFDSMTYALFGETTGQQRKGSEMRSLFASPDDMTTVRFTFEHQHFIYQIERSPEQVLRKKRGDGTTTHGTKVSLTIFDAAMKEQKQITKVGEVDTFIKDLLQLDAKQFFQIILLPQGEFRNFLIASSSEKEKLLRNVFGTVLYQRMTEWLHESQREQKRELDKQSEQIQTLGEQYQWFAEAVSCPTLPEQFTVWAQDGALLAAEIGEQEQSLDRLKKEVAEKEQAFYQGQSINEQKVAYQKRLVAFEQLEQEATTIQVAKKSVSFLQRLEKDQPYLEQIARNRQLQVAKEADLQALLEEQAVLKKTQAQWESHIPLFAEKQQVLKEKREEQAILQGLLPIANEWAQSQIENEQVRQKIARKAEEINEIAQQLAQLSVDLEVSVSALPDQTRLAQTEINLAKAQEQVTRWEENEGQRRQLLAAWEQKSAKVQDKQTQLLLEEQDLLEKESDFKRCQSDYAKKQIAHWQAKLLPGEPCFICGSTEHPLVTEGGLHEIPADWINEEAVALAEQTWEKARARCLASQQQIEQWSFEAEHLNQQVAQRTAEGQAQLAQLQKSLDLSTSLTPREAYQQAWTQFSTEKEQQQALTEKIEQQRLAYEQQCQVKEQLIKEQEAQEKVQVQQQGALASLAKQLDGFTFETLTTKQEATNQVIEELAAAIETHEATGQSLLQEGLILTERQTVWASELAQLQAQNALQEEQLAQRLAQYEEELTEEQLRAQVPSLATLPTLLEKIAAYEEEWTILQRRLAEDEALKTIPWPDLAQLEQDFLVGKAQMEEQKENILAQKHQQTRNAALIEQLQALWRKNQTALDDLGELQHLSATLRGDNSEKLSLERYLLQSFLQEVLIVANQRLVKLTRGRYQFLIAEEKGSYRNSTGLEINIYDDNAGTTRRSQTLSGGESFIAALALALSLADVIQQQAGGIAIEALFIDEGFGSLDEESLEMALEALEMVEQEGRLIGIISHVRELKERVYQQLLVETNGAGQSRTRTISG
ncbi:AAA family ATPase [Enterococcus sp. LJL98]